MIDILRQHLFLGLRSQAATQRDILFFMGEDDKSLNVVINQRSYYYREFVNYFRFKNPFYYFKGNNDRLPSHINFNECREEIAAALNKFCKRWCRRGHVK